MSSTAPFLTGTALRFAGWAVVDAVLAGHVHVRTDDVDDGEGFEVLSPSGAPAVGARVFVLVPEEGRGAVVAAAPVPDPGISLSRKGPVVRLEDRGGNLLFEHDEETGRTVVGVPDGDLEIRVPHGSLRISAAEGITLDSPRLDVAARRASARLGALDLLAGRIRSRARIYRAAVEEVSELRVGKLRLFAKLGMLLKASRGTIETEQDLAVRGRTVRIN
jgi:hypothetical protein